jgi:hypothetical protein
MWLSRPLTAEATPLGVETVSEGLTRLESGEALRIDEPGRVTLGGRYPEGRMRGECARLLTALTRQAWESGGLSRSRTVCFQHHRSGRPPLASVCRYEEGELRQSAHIGLEAEWWRLLASAEILVDSAGLDREGLCRARDHVWDHAPSAALEEVLAPAPDPDRYPFVFYGAVPARRTATMPRWQPRNRPGSAQRRPPVSIRWQRCVPCRRMRLPRLSGRRR